MSYKDVFENIFNNREHKSKNNQRMRGILFVLNRLVRDLSWYKEFSIMLPVKSIRFEKYSFLEREFHNIFIHYLFFMYSIS